jgi:hypothetical protein
MRFPGVVTKDLIKGESVSFLPFDRRLCGYVGFIIESQRKLMVTLLLETLSVVQTVQFEPNHQLVKSARGNIRIVDIMIQNGNNQRYQVEDL